MRDRPTDYMENGRITDGVMASTRAEKCNGAFIVQSKGEWLKVIASNEGGWDHVSVSCAHRCPTWDEMCHIKKQFWRDDETVIQYHPPKHAYQNIHPHCLHMWKKQGSEIELPPIQFV